MTCDDITEPLSAYIDGELAPAECLALERHLAACPGCQMELTALSAMVGSLRALLPIPAPAGVEACAMAMVRRRAFLTEPWRALAASLKRQASTYALAGSGLAAAVVALVVLADQPLIQFRPAQVQPPPAPSGPASPAPSASPPGAPSPEGSAPLPRVATQTVIPPHPAGSTGGPSVFATSQNLAEAAPPGATPLDRQFLASRSGLRGGGWSSRSEVALANGSAAQWDRIAAANADSVVEIHADWRLYDGGTKKPVFEKILRTARGEPALAFVRLKSGRIVRWLTLDDAGGRNASISGSCAGAGFIADAHGGVLTSGSLVAGWTTPFDDRLAAAVILDEASAAGPTATGVVVKTARLADAKTWIPQSGGALFEGDAPVAVQGRPRLFIGRNTKLSVMLAGTDHSVEARVTRLSSDADVARLEIHPTPRARQMALAQSAPLPRTEPLLVLGGKDFLVWRLVRDSTRRAARRAPAGGGSGLTSGFPAKAQGESPANAAVLDMIGHVELAIGGLRSPTHYSLIQSRLGQDVGSPVLGEDGRVVGLVNRLRGPGDPAGDLVLTPISHASALLPPGAAPADGPSAPAARPNPP